MAMKAYCKLCKTYIYPSNDFEFGVMAMSHVLRKHYSHPRYADLIREIVEKTRNDFIIEKDDPPP